MKGTKTSWLALAAGAALLGVACSQGADEASQGIPLSPAAEGQQLYASVCTACHNLNPSAAGGLGPPIAGSPEVLLEAKVLRGEYPPGYTPKRESHAMIPLPYLKDKIPALAAYLASVQAGS